MCWRALLAAAVFFRAAACAAALLGWLCADRAAAQTLDATHLIGPADLGGTHWYFQEGDDAAWARAGFDDSQWKSIDPSKDLKSYANIQRGGVYWYRLHIALPVDGPQAGLRIDSLARAYEVYANGKRLVDTGRFPPDALEMLAPTAVIPIPEEPGGDSQAKARTVVLAVRCALLGEAIELPRPLLDEGKLVLGNYAELDAANKAIFLAYNTRQWAVTLLALLVGGIAFGLYTTQRDQKDYLWVTFWTLLRVGETIVFSLIPGFYTVPRTLYSIVAAGVSAATLLVYLGLYASLVRRKRDAWTYLALAAVGIVFVQELWRRLIVPSATGGLIANSAEAFLLGVVTFWPLVSLAKAWRGGNRDAGLTLIPYVCIVLDLEMGQVLELLVRLGLSTRVPPFFTSGAPIFGVFIDFGTLALALFWFNLAIIVVLRSNRLSREHANMAGELAAAGEVQALLVPEKAPLTPGFKVESAYQPAQQLGGDFFLVMPGADRSLLLVIGDVSGKGLRAAMVVSTIVGIVRTERSREPHALLDGLNRGLAGVIDGFVTCQCARIAADGATAIANAGHLPPYLDGQEIEVSGALPLGITADAAYESQELQLPVGSRLTFLSDGVPEAQNAAGELMGFERARALSTAGAAEIVKAAQAFGQADDITVLAVTRL